MTYEEAEAYLLSLELFGMRFGLDRMRRLMTVLGHPERSFRQVHVVGTNGKSSTARMIAGILERHGLRTGTYLSPHLVSFTERVRVGEADLAPERFAAAVARARRAAERVNRSLGEGDGVTQFEALTAAAYSELAEQGVEVAVIEAGLGGRFDATNVIDSEVQVLTGVGLEHTRWLGPTVADIAREKVDVVRPGATLVVGTDLHPDALGVAERLASERGARIVCAREDEGLSIGALGSFQRRNFALARAAAGALLGELDERAVAGAAAEIRVPGRLQVVDQRPLTLLDGAHNPAGMQALVESLPGLVAPGAPVVGVVSILDDKDAAGMLRLLLAHTSSIVFTVSRNPRSLPAPTLASLAGQLGGPPAELAPNPAAAMARARQLAGEQGVVLATGSIYLIADLLAPPAAARASTL